MSGDSKTKEKHGQARTAGLIALTTLVALGVGGFGCAARPKPLELVWPEPPETPRIKFVRTLSSEEDLRNPSAWQKLGDLAIGRERPVGHISQPIGLAVSDDTQRLYVSDFAQGLVYVFDFGEGEVTLLGRQQPLGRPAGLAIDAADNLYVVDQDKNRILVFDRTYNLTRIMTPPEIVRATGIALDRKRGVLYVADTSKNSSPDHFVRAYDLEGHFIRNVGKGRGLDPGFLMFPTYVYVDDSGHLYVSDTINARISEFDADGNFVGIFGAMGEHYGEMYKPKGVALDTFGNLYVVDSAWSVVQIYNKLGQPLLFFGGRNAYPGMLQNPTAIAIDRKNRIYVADTYNFRVNVYDLINTSAADSVPEPKPATGNNGPS